MKLYALDKIVYRLHPKAARFLGDYSTNVPAAPHNAFVDLKGKIVATFEQYRISDDEVLLVVEKAFAERLEKHLKQYLFLCDVSLDRISVHVYWNIEGMSQSAGGMVIPLEAGSIVISEKALPAEVSEEEFRLFRLRHCMPVQGLDYDETMLLNVHPTRYVSYTKGCYLGQEIIARVHYKGTPPYRLMVKTPGATSQAKDPQTGQILGFDLEKIVK